VAQDVLGLWQERPAEGRAGEVAQLILAAPCAAVAQGRVVGFGVLGGKVGPEALQESSGVIAYVRACPCQPLSIWKHTQGCLDFLL
jgi:hypothetical protein